MNALTRRTFIGALTAMIPGLSLVQRVVGIDPVVSVARISIGEINGDAFECKRHRSGSQSVSFSGIIQRRMNDVFSVKLPSGKEASVNCYWKGSDFYVEFIRIMTPIKFGTGKPYEKTICSVVTYPQVTR